jgi:COMPASS component SWD3
MPADSGRGDDTRHVAPSAATGGLPPIAAQHHPRPPRLSGLAQPDASVSGGTGGSGGALPSADMLLERKSDAEQTTRSVMAIVDDAAVFDPGEPAIKSEVIQVIVQYLQDEGYMASSLIVQDEANVKMKNTSNKRSQLRRMRRAITNGEWGTVEAILAQKATTFRYQSHFLYAMFRQQYLELIDSQQPQKALQMLTKKLKPLERFAQSKTDFRDLCYLLTCQSVTESDQFADWDGANASRAALVEQCARLLDCETFLAESMGPSASVRGMSTAPSTLTPHIGGELGGGVPPGRLVNLIRQAIAFQVESSMYKLRAPPRIGTILEDFECAVVPNARRRTFAGHRGNVKCVTFVGAEGRAIATGSSDNTARVWGSVSGKLLGDLRGHRSRIWDVSASTSGSLLATASADGTVRLWGCGELLEEEDQWSAPIIGGAHSAAGYLSTATSPVPTSSLGNDAASSRDTDLRTHDGEDESRDDASMRTVASLATMGLQDSPDVYAVRFHPHGELVVTGGYESDVRLYDVETQRLVHTFTGHESAVSCVAFNSRGTLVITGSKDATVRYWDVLSGLCVKTLSSHLGEVTSVSTNAAGTLLLTSSKDNSNRLWDIRQSRPMRRFKGHQNTSKNFLRASFGPLERLILGGSEDGYVYIWDADTEDIAGKLGPANGTVYSTEWSPRRSLLVSCSHDGLASTWCYDPSVF